MASYLQIENISKSYGPKVLFEKIGFNINEGDKIALIAPNGTGKTSLMRILAGKDKSDSGGKIMFLKDIKIAFLEQEYDFDPEKTIFDQIMSSSSEFTKGLDQEHVWEYERRVVKFLSNFNLNNPDQLMKELSGGEVKRVALTQMLASEAEFFIMDEPTNHLDIDAIEFLEGYLGRSRCTLLMVTHDRYFLDRVCNIVMEMDHGAVYTYRGNYQNYLEKREERISNYNAETDKVRNILRRELEWIRSTPCARTGKARYRINAFYDLKDRASQVYTQKQVSMEAMKGSTRLGTKIVNCKDLSFYYGDKCYLDGFTYNFQRYEKVGIVGRNGAGKSTLMKLMTDHMPRTKGEILWNGKDICKMGRKWRELVGYTPQLQGVYDDFTAKRFLYYMGVLKGMKKKDIREETDIMLEAVNLTHAAHKKIGTFSGGMRQRVLLASSMLGKPQVLILDEPTRGVDIGAKKEIYNVINPTFTQNFYRSLDNRING